MILASRRAGVCGQRCGSVRSKAFSVFLLLWLGYRNGGVGAGSVEGRGIGPGLASMVGFLQKIAVRKSWYTATTRSLSRVTSGERIRALLLVSPRILFRAFHEDDRAI